MRHHTIYHIMIVNSFYIIIDYISLRYGDHNGCVKRGKQLFMQGELTRPAKHAQRRFCRNEPSSHQSSGRIPGWSDWSTIRTAHGYLYRCLERYSHSWVVELAGYGYA